MASSIAVYATISASEVDYKNAQKVLEALDDLYAKVKPDYTGATSVTPNESTQILSTNDKLLKSNITIHPIPSTYKRLDTTTTATSSDIVSGKTAYDNSGNLITGTSINTTFTTYLIADNSSSGASAIQLKNSGFTKFKYTSYQNATSNTSEVYAMDSSFSNKTVLNINTEYAINDTYYRLYLKKKTGTGWSQIRLVLYN